MVEIIWEFVVKEETRGQFELLYGPGGAWSNLFTRNPHFRGITVLRDTKNSNRFLIIELWEKEAHRVQALVELESEHSDLEAVLAQWTESRSEMGVFSIRAEATVFARGKAGRNKTGEARRRR